MAWTAECISALFLVAGLWNLVAIPDGNIPSAVGTACNILVSVPCLRGDILGVWVVQQGLRRERGLYRLASIGRESKHRTDPTQTTNIASPCRPPRDNAEQTATSMMSVVENPTRRPPCAQSLYTTARAMIRTRSNGSESPSISLFHPPLRTDAMPCDAMQIVVHVPFPTSPPASAFSQNPPI